MKKSEFFFKKSEILAKNGLLRRCAPVAELTEFALQTRAMTEVNPSLASCLRALSCTAERIL